MTTDKKDTMEQYFRDRGIDPKELKKGIPKFLKEVIRIDRAKREDKK